MNTIENVEKLTENMKQILLSLLDGIIELIDDASTSNIEDSLEFIQLVAKKTLAVSLPMVNDPEWQEAFRAHDSLDEARAYLGTMQRVVDGEIPSELDSMPWDMLRENFELSIGCKRDLIAKTRQQLLDGVTELPFSQYIALIC